MVYYGTKKDGKLTLKELRPTLFVLHDRPGAQREEIEARKKKEKP